MISQFKYKKKNLNTSNISDQASLLPSNIFPCLAIPALLISISTPPYCISTSENTLKISSSFLTSHRKGTIFPLISLSPSASSFRDIRFENLPKIPQGILITKINGNGKRILRLIYRNS